MRNAVLALLAVAALVAAGCGSSPEGDAKKTVSTAISGLSRGNAKKVCNQLTVGAQRQLLVLLAHNPLGFPDIRATSCRDAITKLHAALTKEQRAVLEDGEVDQAKVTGDRATVHVVGAGMTAKLQRFGDKWKITGGLFQ
jgi:hypothetical protein